MKSAPNSEQQLPTSSEQLKRTADGLRTSDRNVFNNGGGEDEDDPPTKACPNGRRSKHLPSCQETEKNSLTIADAKEAQEAVAQALQVLKDRVAGDRGGTAGRPVAPARRAIAAFERWGYTCMDIFSLI